MRFPRQPSSSDRQVADHRVVAETCRAEASSMPAGPAAGRDEAERRALTTPSTAPASRTRWGGAWIWVRNPDASAGNTFAVPKKFPCGSRAVFFRRRSLRRRAHGRRVHPAHSMRGHGDVRHGHRWRERPRLDDLGSLAGQDSGVVHAIVGSSTATRPPTATAAQSAAAVARPMQDAAIPTLARTDSSPSHQG